MVSISISDLKGKSRTGNCYQNLKHRFSFRTLHSTKKKKKQLKEIYMENNIFKCSEYFLLKQMSLTYLFRSRVTAGIIQELAETRIKDKDKRKSVYIMLNGFISYYKVPKTCSRTFDSDAIGQSE